jgi:hypothetical protein
VTDSILNQKIQNRNKIKLGKKFPKVEKDQQDFYDEETANDLPF